MLSLRCERFRFRRVVSTIEIVHLIRSISILLLRQSVSYRNRFRYWYPPLSRPPIKTTAPHRTGRSSWEQTDVSGIVPCHIEIDDRSILVTNPHRCTHRTRLPSWEQSRFIGYRITSSLIVVRYPLLTRPHTIHLFFAPHRRQVVETGGFVGYRNG